jgi:hypothetical protein
MTDLFSPCAEGSPKAASAFTDLIIRLRLKLVSPSTAHRATAANLYVSVDEWESLIDVISFVQGSLSASP